MIKIEIACADNEQRPNSPFDEGINSDSHWVLLASGETAFEALYELVELANDEQFSLENNWLRIKRADGTIVE